MTLDTILDEIKKAEKIVILTHEGPDGDAIGSSLGLGFALEKLGKKPDIIIPEYSKSFSFMPGIDRTKKESNIEKYDLAISLDCADSKILKGYSKYFERARRKIVIDHHGSNTMYGDINFINPDAPACAQILIGMFQYFKIELSKDMATCIMTGIVTDTGGFCFNATSETFEFAADILRLGVNISEIFRKTLHTKNMANFELNRRAADRMEFLEDGKVAFTYITLEDEIEVGATQGDHEGIVEVGKSIENVEVSIFLHEVKDKGFKVSLRSLEYVNVANIAIMLGGGGHRKAAGAYCKGTPEQIKNKVLQEVRKQLK
jgi:phosphoesterase RecJ-like protein